jgi:DNA processing protein
MQAQFVEWTTFQGFRDGRDTPEMLPGLWQCGDASALGRPSVAIVGTRAATAHGRRVATRFARELSAAGCCIISGLALGIDAAAHAGALEAGAPTIGVLGGGHERFFPERNAALAERMIAEGGAVLSPFAPDAIARPFQFLARNGVVAALADAVVVIEAPQRSGALNTAAWAAGRIPVFAVPGDIDRPHVRGCHALIRDGATLARDANDVLMDLRLGPAAQPVQQPLPMRTDPLENALIEALRCGERSLDALVACCKQPVHAVLASLAMLELEQIVERRDGNVYALAR